MENGKLQMENVKSVGATTGRPSNTELRIHNSEFSKPLDNVNII
jgi:hypothetical protein